MATVIAARHVCRQWGHGITGHFRPASAADRPRRRQRPTGLEHCSNAVFDGLPAQTIASSSTLKRVESNSSKFNIHGVKNGVVSMAMARRFRAAAYM